MCCCNTRIIQIGGGGAPFTFNVSAGTGPIPGGPVTSGPIAMNSGDTIHFWSINSLDFQVIPGSVNVGAEIRLDPNPLNTLSLSPAGLLGLGSAYSWNVGHNIGAHYTINNGDTWKVSSGNNTIDTVNMGGLTTGFNVRIDPAPGNAITTSIAGIYVPSGGVNSDRNLKENIKVTDLSATAVINAMDIVEYNFKSDPNKETLHGLIAQDLYEVYPEAVTKGGGDKPWRIDYSKLVPVLLESIKELSARIEVLENK